MAYHDDLLDQALHLARRDLRRPKQVNLRRAVSSAYYALFHLLIAEAAAYWRLDRQRAAFGRGFEHRKMKGACNNCITSDPNLRTVTDAFVDLQQNRHRADYDISRTWTRVEVVTLIDRAKSAVQKWGLIRDTGDAQDLLLSLFISERR